MDNCRELHDYAIAPCLLLIRRALRPQQQFCSKLRQVWDICRIITVGILVCYIAAAAIEIDKWSSNNDGTKYRVWPSWGWICAIVAGALWFFVGTFAACEFARSFHGVIFSSHGRHDAI